MKSRRSLVLEIVLVVGLVAAVGAMGFINLTDARRAKNEKHARLLLLAFHRAQQNFVSEVQSDRDEDEEGEFGTLSELLTLQETQSYRRFELFDVPAPQDQQATLEELRQKLGIPETEPTSDELLDPEKRKKVIAKRIKLKTPPQFLFESPIFNRVANRLGFDGYAFRIFLPQLAQDRKDLTEEDKIKALTDDVEKYWCAYAWPMSYGNSGLSSYFIDKSGRLYACEDPNLSENKSPKVRAIDAYKGREFTSPINDDVWKVWTAPKSPEQIRREEEAKRKQEEAEKAAAEAKEGEGPEGEGEEGAPAGEGGVTPAGTGEGTPGKGSRPRPPRGRDTEDLEKERKLLEEATDDVGLEANEGT